MDKIPLKKLITHQNKGTYIPLLTGIFLIFYTVSGAISNQFAMILPMPSFERDIPFLPWTIWIYIVLYPLYLIWVLYSYKDEYQLNKTLYSFMMLMLISCIIFIIFPVAYPRSFFPLPPEKSLTMSLFHGTRALDKPSNCLPSLHVGICYLFAFSNLGESRVKFLVSITLSTIIGISTLTTKQHYIYDLVAGFLLATSLYYFFKSKTTIVN